MGAFEANSEPQAPNPGPRASVEGNVFSLTGLFPFTDADVTDTHNATVDWGDGSPVEPLVVTEVQWQRQSFGQPCVCRRWTVHRHGHGP